MTMTTDPFPIRRTFTAANGVPFTVVVIPEGTEPNKSSGVVVEFYDARHAHTVYGQFVARYPLDAIVKRADVGAGLDLDGGVDDWTIDGATMGRLGMWARDPEQPLVGTVYVCDDGTVYRLHRYQQSFADLMAAAETGETAPYSPMYDYFGISGGAAGGMTKLPDDAKEVWAP